MAVIKKRYSDNGRKHVLETTVSTAEKSGDNYVSPETVQKIITFLTVWLEKLLQLNKYLSEREKEIREKNDALDFLDMIMRDVWEVVKRRVRRQKLPAEVLTYYGLPLSGIVPKIGKEKDLLATAANMIKGDEEAIAAGYEAMINPSAAELQVALDAAKKELSEVAPADRNYDKAEEAVADLRPEADSLIEDVIDELKLKLRKRDAASQRRIISSYGAEIEYNTGNGPVDDEPIE